MTDDTIEKCDICKHRTCLLDEFPCNKCKEFVIDGEDMFEMDWGEQIIRTRTRVRFILFKNFFRTYYVRKNY